MEGGSGDENGPLVSVLFFFFFFWILTITYRFVIYEICDRELDGRRWWRQRTQMMPDMSFGPLVRLTIF